MADAARPRFVPPPFQDAAEQGRLILRDGSTATIRVAKPEDVEALRAFFEGLSPESRRRRFFSAAPPVPELISSLSDSSDPRSALTLLVMRTSEGAPPIVATGSYFAKDEQTAEVAFAVDKSFQGKGLGTVLLERLAVLAVRNGFTRFWAITHADNRAMRDVFRESGFAVAEELRGSEIEVDLSVAPNEAAVARLETRDRIATAASLRPFFRPRSVAVVGASRDPASIGYRILEALVGNRFQGPVYPVNRKATVLSCIRAYPSVRDLPEPVDLAVIAVPRDAVLGVVDECAARGVRALVVVTAGLPR
jgi:acetate---CoA ligase (ADP-forming)